MALSINQVDTVGEWMVDTHHLYIPSKGIQIDHEDVSGSDSGRTQDGMMHIDWVRRDVAKVNFKWAYMSESELANIISWMQGKEFTLKYYDVGVVKTISAYASNIHYNMETRDYLGTGEALYSDISINAIEK